MVACYYEGVVGAILFALQLLILSFVMRKEDTRDEQLRCLHFLSIAKNHTRTISLLQV